MNQSGRSCLNWRGLVSVGYQSWRCWSSLTQPTVGSLYDDWYHYVSIFEFNSRMFCGLQNVVIGVIVDDLQIRVELHEHLQLSGSSLSKGNLDWRISRLLTQYSDWFHIQVNDAWFDLLGLDYTVFVPYSNSTKLRPAWESNFPRLVSNHVWMNLCRTVSSWLSRNFLL